MTKKSGRQRSVASENDESLMERAARGQTAALATLIDRYYMPILAYLFRLTGGRRQVAEDLAQETFLRLMRQASYQTGRAFRPWLYAVATNLAHDHFRAAGQREENGHDAVLAEIVDNVPGPEARAEAAEQGRAVAAWLAQFVQINGGAVSGWAGPPAWLTQPALFALSAGSCS
jgi:DNA-directed RNA polymerase specialized sigma24 family protein